MRSERHAGDAVIRTEILRSSTGQRVEVPVGPGATCLAAQDLVDLPCVHARIRAGVLAPMSMIRRVYELHVEAVLSDRGETDGGFIDLSRGTP